MYGNMVVKLHPLIADDHDPDTSVSDGCLKVGVQEFFHVPQAMEFASTDVHTARARRVRLEWYLMTETFPRLSICSLHNIDVLSLVSSIRLVTDRKHKHHRDKQNASTPRRRQLSL
jgi:hypothetical protein